MKRICMSLALLASAFFISGCSTHPPVQEYVQARTAFEWAKDYDAPRYAPNLWAQGDELYRLGQKQYKEEKFSVAKASFEQALYYLEQAESAARLKRSETGGGPPP